MPNPKHRRLGTYQYLARSSHTSTELNTTSVAVPNDGDEAISIPASLLKVDKCAKKTRLEGVSKCHFKRPMY
jgi:hypothetical protein